jgi:hypothetical protein
MTDDIRVSSLPAVALFFETGVTKIRESEVVVSGPRQASTLIFNFWVFNSEFFARHSCLSCTPILLFNDIHKNLVLPEVSLTPHLYAERENRNPQLLTALWISHNT